MQIASTLCGTQKPIVALVGNPNTGKTTLFNSLTGAQQKVGNYAGVTVEVFSTELQCGSLLVDCVDVPGLYSLNPLSLDEEIATNILQGSPSLLASPDLLVCVLDVNNLERNLYFLSHIANTKKPVVVVLTMTDILAQHSTEPGHKVIGKFSHLQSLNDISRKNQFQQKFRKTLAKKLETALGVEVIPVVAHKQQGIQELKEAIERNLQNPRFLDIQLPQKNKHFSETAQRYQWASEIRKQIIPDELPNRVKAATDRIDAILTHRVWGLGIFVTLMITLFEAIYTFARPLMNGISWMFENIGSALGSLLEDVPILQSLLVDGVLRGMGSVLVFLPQIAILFFFISMLESTGYLARAAFLMDKLLGWCGLNGRAFIPLLSSYACAIPGIMAARVMPDPKSRLATILVAPLMSCSARLPVYVLLIGAFIEPQYGALWAGMTLFGMHLVGLTIAIPLIWLLNKSFLKVYKLPFIFELPPYQKPKWKDIWRTVYMRAKDFVKTAGSIIVVMSVVMWALLYFPRFPEEKIQHQITSAAMPNTQKQDVGFENYIHQQQITHSYLGRLGKLIEPIFVPAGFDWRLSTAILAAFPARENLVSSLGIIFQLGDKTDPGSQGLYKALREAKWPDGAPLVTTWTAIGLMVFFALCCQCMATLAVARRETGSWKWPLFMFFSMTTLAYLAAVLIHCLSRLF